MRTPTRPHGSVIGGLARGDFWRSLPGSLLENRSLAGVVLLTALGLMSCNAGNRLLDWEGNPEEPADMSVPPLTCEKGRLRCTANRDATEECDGKTWRRKVDCNTTAGDTCVEGLCRTQCDLVPRGNVGCSFFPVNLWSTSTVGELGIVVTNTSETLSADVTLDGPVRPTPSNRQTVAPGAAVIFRVPHGDAKLTQTEQAMKGMHLTSTAPVAVYQFHPIDAATVFSGSATLLLPEHVMAKNYFVMSYTYNAELITTPPQGQGLLAVVALSDATKVEVTVPVETMPGPGVPGLKAGQTMTRTLNRMEVLEVAQLKSREDISGATVKASAPVAVYGGAGGVSIPMSAVGGNHLGVQMFPLETWGKRYMAAKVKQRNATDRDYYRIVASVDNTTISFKGGPGLPMTVPKLARSQTFEFSTAADFIIEADQPILAFQYMPAWGNLSGAYDATQFPDGLPTECPGSTRSGPDSVRCLGDANITPLIPIEQFRKDYIFYVPRTYKYNYINVYAPLDTKLMLDGAPVTETFKTIVDNLGRAILRIKEDGKNHRLTADQPFGIIGYGYAYATSYSYAGGLNLAKINPIE
jgi:hypothetical protein